VRGEIDPDTVADGETVDSLADRVDDTRAVLARHGVGLGRRLVAGADALLPVGGVHPRHNDAHTNLAGGGLGQVAIDEVENVGGAVAGVDDALHTVRTRCATGIIP